MKHSEALDQLFSALVEAQKEYPELEKSHTANIPTKNGGSYSYKYADLADTLAAIRPVLNEHGITIIQFPSDGALTTVIGHSSGQYISSDFPLPLGADANAQEIGSALTYIRRYCWQAAAGVAAESDDDGAAASGNPPGKLKCPKCGKDTVRKWKDKGNLTCWKKEGVSDGCNAKWDDEAAYKAACELKEQPKTRQPAKQKSAPKADERTPDERYRAAMACIKKAPDTKQLKMLRGDVLIRHGEKVFDDGMAAKLLMEVHYNASELATPKELDEWREWFAIDRVTVQMHDEQVEKITNAYDSTQVAA